LLVSCAAESVDAVLAAFHADGFSQAAVIGEMNIGLTDLGHEKVTVRG
jgi:selenide,water dikinase